MIVLSSRSKLVAQIIVAGLMVTPLFIFSMLFAKGDLFSFGKSFFIDILNITVFSFVVIWWLAIFINLKLNLKTSKCRQFVNLIYFACVGIGVSYGIYSGYMNEFISNSTIHIPCLLIYVFYCHGLCYFFDKLKKAQPPDEDDIEALLH